MATDQRDVGQVLVEDCRWCGFPSYGKTEHSDFCPKVDPSWYAILTGRTRPGPRPRPRPDRTPSRRPLPTVTVRPKPVPAAEVVVGETAPDVWSHSLAARTWSTRSEAFRDAMDRKTSRQTVRFGVLAGPSTET